LRVVACLGAWLALPGLRGDLGGFARELADLNCPVVSEFACFKVLTALPFGKFVKSVSISAKSPNSKEKYFYMQG
jgi:hypothetical protein